MRCRKSVVVMIVVRGKGGWKRLLGEGVGHWTVCKRLAGALPTGPGGGVDKDKDWGWEGFTARTARTARTALYESGGVSTTVALC